jgi:methylmalonyl-CoA/ethylmalonyl-CoA epimerase
MQKEGFEMAPKSEPIMLSNRSHLGIVVKSVDETANLLSSLFGIGPWEVSEITEYYKPEIKGPEELGVGEPFTLRMAFADFGSMRIELLEPLGTSVYSEFIRTNGEGLHHLAFNCPNWDEMVSEILKQGGKILAGGFYEGNRWCFIQTKPGGIILEPLDNFDA